MPFRFNSRKAPPADCIGLSLYPGGFACCVVDRTANKLVGTYFQDLSSDSGLADALLHWVRDSNLKGRICYVCLGPDDYKLLPAETPPVPEAEINQALLWGLREVLDTKPEDTVLDSFASASGIHRSGKPIRQAVAARKTRIRAIVDAVLGAGLELGAIDIPELSQRNAIARLQENTIGVGLVSQNWRGVSVAVYRGGELYITRQLTGISNLADAGHPLTAPRLVEQLGLELLRTLDYYDSQLRQRPPAAIFLQPLAIETRPLLDGLSATINLPAKQLRYADVIAGADAVSGETIEHCFSALGAALRDENAPQQINLYTDEFRPQHKWLTPQNCLGLWGGALALGLAIAVVQGWNNHRLSAEVKTLQAQVGSEQSNLEADQATLAQRKPSQELSAELERTTTEETAKKELLAALQNGTLSGDHGYTQILVGLARNTIEGLWLTDIEIKDGDVNLSGTTRKADFIPEYIDKIVSDNGIGRREYRSLKLQSSDKELLTFELRGHRDTGVLK